MEATNPDPVPPETIADLTFRLDIYNAIDWYEVALRSLHSAHKLRRFHLGGMSILIGLLLVPAILVTIGCFNQPSLSRPAIFFAAISLLVVGATALLSTVVYDEVKNRSPVLRTQLQAQARVGMVSGDFDEQRIVVTTHSVTQHRRNGFSQQRWTGISRIDRADQTIVIRQHGGNAYIIPIRAFTDPAAAARFLETCTALIACHGSEADPCLIEYLRNRSVPCPGCKYDLRNLAAPKCPECGLPVNVGLLKMTT